MKLASPTALLYALFGLGLGVFEFTLVWQLVLRAPNHGFSFGDWFLLAFASAQILLSLTGLILAIRKPKR